MERAPTKYPGITKRTWRDRSGVIQTRYDVVLRGAGGERRSRSFRKSGSAKAYLREQRDSMDRGAWVDPRVGKETLAAYFGRWRERAVVKRKPTERTLLAYDEIFDNLVRPKLGSRSLASITRRDVEEVVAAAGTRSAWRAHDALKLVRRLLSAAVDDGAIVRNPASRVEAPQIEKAAPWILSRQEVDRLADAVPERYRALVLVGAYTSLRWSELVALRVGRLDLPARQLHVGEKIVEAGHLISGEPKTERSRRSVTIPESAARSLEAHLALFPSGEDGLIFTARAEGGPIRRPHFGRIWRKATAAAGLDGFPFRNLRHSGATWALEAGISPVLVAFRLGHTTTRMIETHYADRLKAADREIADRLDATPTSASSG